MATFLVALGLLVSGSSALTFALAEGLPAGTPLTWAGLVSLPLMALTGISTLAEPTTRRARIYAGIFKALLGLALAWGLASFALAGNWSYSFSSSVEGFRGSNRASPYFFKLTYATAGLPLLLSLAYGLHAWWAERRTERDRETTADEHA